MHTQGDWWGRGRMEQEINKRKKKTFQYDGWRGNVCGWGMQDRLQICFRKKMYFENTDVSICVYIFAQTCQATYNLRSHVFNPYLTTQVHAHSSHLHTTLHQTLSFFQEIMTIMLCATGFFTLLLRAQLGGNRTWSSVISEVSTMTWVISAFSNPKITQ